MSNNLKESRTRSMHSGTGMKARKIPAKNFTPNTEEIFSYKLLQTLKEVKDRTQKSLKINIVKKYNHQMKNTNELVDLGGEKQKKTITALQK